MFSLLRPDLVEVEENTPGELTIRSRRKEKEQKKKIETSERANRQRR